MLCLKKMLNGDNQIHLAQRWYERGDFLNMAVRF
jgi:hypothetical protein